MKKTAQHLTYMKALQLIADQSRQQMAALMPHMGERGRIAEEIIKSILTRTLPKRFSVGSGVIVSATGDCSPQIDIVIYDNFHNAPLLSEFGACVYPVEIVYATIEVKSVLTKKEFRKCLSDIRKIRTLGSRRHYIAPEITRRDRNLVITNTRRVLTVPPRNYVIAFSQTGFGKTYAAFKRNLTKSLEEPETFIHGVCVLRDDWFAGRVAYEPASKLYGSEKDGLLNFYVSLLKGQQNYNVFPIDLDAYLTDLPNDEGGAPTT
jgi:hypothetical protein